MPIADTIQNNPRKMLVNIGIVIGMLAALLIGVSLYRSLTFHVTSTNPPRGDVTNLTPFFKVSFNQTLESKGTNVSMSPNLISSWSINGKTVTILFKSQFSTATTYTVIISSISSTKGKHISNLRFILTPHTGSWNNLPADQQQALLVRQSTKAKGATSSKPAVVDLTGTQILIDRGLTAAQLAALQNAFYTFTQTKNKKITTASIPAGSLSVEPHNPEATSTANTMHFAVTTNAGSYKATLVYDNLTQSRLYLYDPATNDQLYDSGIVDVSNTPPT